MKTGDLFVKLDDIYCRYERLTSLISILQLFVAEQVDITGEREGSIASALFEIELGMDENNELLKVLLQQKGGVA